VSADTVIRSVPSDGGPSRAVIYVRVSTDKQAASGVGGEAQEQACRKYCELRGLEVLEVVADSAVSGMEEAAKRPGLQRVIEIIGSHAKGDVLVVVYKLDRLARSQRIIWELLDPRGKFGLPLASATQDFNTATPIGRAMVGMLGVWAELDWENIRDRNMAMQRAARARGSRIGGPRMHERGGQPDPEKVEIVLMVQDLYSKGSYTLKTLAEKLNADGIPSPRGRRWHGSTVFSALRAKV